MRIMIIGCGIYAGLEAVMMAALTAWTRSLRHCSAAAKVNWMTQVLVITPCHREPIFMKFKSTACSHSSHSVASAISADRMQGTAREALPLQTETSDLGQSRFMKKLQEFQKGTDRLQKQISSS